MELLISAIARKSAGTLKLLLRAADKYCANIRRYPALLACSYETCRLLSVTFAAGQCANFLCSEISSENVWLQFASHMTVWVVVWIIGAHDIQIHVPCIWRKPPLSVSAGALVSRRSGCDTYLARTYDGVAV